jgi:hypothetical protein
VATGKVAGFPLRPAGNKRPELTAVPQVVNRKTWCWRCAISPRIEFRADAKMHRVTEDSLMSDQQNTEKLGLNLSLQRPMTSDLEQIPVTRDKAGNVIYPELDADGDHLHFEMVPMGGESLLWLTMRRGTTPELASASLRKIADLIDRHGQKLLTLLEGNKGSFNAEGDVVSGPLRLGYDENGDIVFPDQPTTSPRQVPR